MAKDAMTETYTLDLPGINEGVTRISPGAYAIGKIYHADADTSLFTVRRVGRSDDDVKAALVEQSQQYHGFPFPYRYLFRFCGTAREAFALECGLYHDYAPRDNLDHPRPPPRSGWTCPRCKLAG
jgi:hypothetical protein